MPEREQLIGTVRQGVGEAMTTCFLRQKVARPAGKKDVIARDGHAISPGIDRYSWIVIIRENGGDNTQAKHPGSGKAMPVVAETGPMVDAAMLGTYCTLYALAIR